MTRRYSCEEWLKLAAASGYERGFYRAPNPELLELERQGLIERNPTSSKRKPQWRITAAGQAKYQGR